MSTASRRSFLEKAMLGTVSATGLARTQALDADPTSNGVGAGNPSEQTPTWYGLQHCVTEWAFHSVKVYSDPFNDIELDVVFTDPQGREDRVPAFWAGEQVWRIRYAPRSIGRYRYRTICSDSDNPKLHGQTGLLEVSPYAGDNALLKHGPIRVASDRLHLEHEDGTPFFWLGDTWWMGLCKRLRWPDDFQTLLRDRTKKGFTIVQIIAGLYPDMPPFDSRADNEAGYAWEADFTRINPHYFDMADLRIQCLVDNGIVPCIVGCWGFFLPLMGVPKAKKHWRYIIARWGGYPAVWCLAGETTMPFYLSKNESEDSAIQKRGWTEVGRYVRSIDPYHHPITVHPSTSARDSVEDQTVLDIDMLQTGHEDVWSIPNTVNQVTSDLLRMPRMPVLVGEVTYEGHKQQNRQQVVRFMFWSCMLSGVAGHTYGAGGIWEVQTRAHPYGASPWGGGYGDLPWDIAYQYPGSQQLGWGKQLLMRYEWWRLEPHPEWVEPHWNKENHLLPFAAGIPGEVRIVFVPLNMWQLPKIRNLDPHVTYEGFWFDPAMGKEYTVGKVASDPDGAYQLPRIDHIDLVDWIFVLENPGKVKKTTNSQIEAQESGNVLTDSQALSGW